MPDELFRLSESHHPSSKIPLPFMKTMNEAEALSQRENDHCYAFAYMIETWLGGILTFGIIRLIGGVVRTVRSFPRQIMSSKKICLSSRSSRHWSMPTMTSPFPGPLRNPQFSMPPRLTADITDRPAVGTYRFSVTRKTMRSR